MRGSRHVDLEREYVEFKIETELFKISVVHLIISLTRDGGGGGGVGSGRRWIHPCMRFSSTAIFLPLEVMTG